MKTCRKCERLFEPRQRHFYLCRTCWRTQRPSYPSIHSPAPLPVIPAYWYQRLRMLVHPDKHANSKLATETFQWLNQQRM